MFESFGFQIIKHRRERNWSEDDLATHMQKAIEVERESLTLSPEANAEIVADDIRKWQSNLTRPNIEELDVLVKLLITDNTTIDGKEAVEKEFRTAYANETDKCKFGYLLSNLSDSAGFQSPTELATKVSSKINENRWQAKIAQMPDVDWEFVAKLQAGDIHPNQFVLEILIKVFNNEKELTETEIGALRSTANPVELDSHSKPAFKGRVEYDLKKLPDTDPDLTELVKTFYAAKAKVLNHFIDTNSVKMPTKTAIYKAVVGRATLEATPAAELRSTKNKMSALLGCNNLSILQSSYDGVKVLSDWLGKVKKYDSAQLKSFESDVDKLDEIKAKIKTILDSKNSRQNVNLPEEYALIAIVNGVETKKAGWTK